ncbi:MAG TPA: DUF2069 domain-containing protein [Xanthomonadaceae bacterium]|nr:DUF2069 domain-containing protein [Xanthomonadaceae bacterium]
MSAPSSRPGRGALVACLAALALLYACWFLPREPVALLVFGLPPALLALLGWRGSARAGFFAGVLALLWFSHGVMVAWTRPPERGFAWLEIALALAVVWFASAPGLRARFAKRKPRA